MGANKPEPYPGEGAHSRAPLIIRHMLRTGDLKTIPGVGVTPHTPSPLFRYPEGRMDRK